MLLFIKNYVYKSYIFLKNYHHSKFPDPYDFNVVPTSHLQFL